MSYVVEELKICSDADMPMFFGYELWLQVLEIQIDLIISNAC
ncbi:hypothetical protein P3T75_00670 [Enterococcus montenegrensis]|nr:hypothetical protein [Enterococcus montenegrensis]MDT2739255.1 hypothetical protein [Enterococcus canintestini]WHA09386.1 hypothetical protein P3T75_00670 [Enterococcus montenegrensis]